MSFSPLEESLSSRASSQVVQVWLQEGFPSCYQVINCINVTQKLIPSIPATKSQPTDPHAPSAICGPPCNRYSSLAQPPAVEDSEGQGRHDISRPRRGGQRTEWRLVVLRLHNTDPDDVMSRTNSRCCTQVLSDSLAVETVAGTWKKLDWVIRFMQTSWEAYALRKFYAR